MMYRDSRAWSRRHGRRRVIPHEAMDGCRRRPTRSAAKSGDDAAEHLSASRAVRPDLSARAMDGPC